jgi:hypothetical protein
MLSYFDESGIHHNSEACIVAGYFGKKGPWRVLESGWVATLKKFKVPLAQFHAKDAVNKAGFFHGWETARLEDFLDSLGRLVRECPIHPVCYGIFTKDFYSLSLSERRFLTGATWHAGTGKFLSSGCPTKPYFVAFNECLRIVTSYTSTADHVHFFFGSDRPSSEYAKRLFRYLRHRAVSMRQAKVSFDSRCSPEKFGMIRFPSAKDTPGLQLADLFSYLSYKHMLERRENGDWNSPPCELLLSLLRNRKTPLDTSYRTAELLRNMMSVVPGLPQQ